MTCCSFKTCSITYHTIKVRKLKILLHRFPKNKTVRAAWIQKIGRKGDPDFKVETARVCSLHFSKDAYLQDMHNHVYHGYLNRILLKEDAVPTIERTSFSWGNVRKQHRTHIKKLKKLKKIGLNSTSFSQGEHPREEHDPNITKTEPEVTSESIHNWSPKQDKDRAHYVASVYERNDDHTYTAKPIDIKEEPIDDAEPIQERQDNIEQLNDIKLSDATLASEPPHEMEQVFIKMEPVHTTELEQDIESVITDILKPIHKAEPTELEPAVPEENASLSNQFTASCKEITKENAFLGERLLLKQRDINNCKAMCEIYKEKIKFLSSYSCRLKRELKKHKT